MMKKREAAGWKMVFLSADLGGINEAEGFLCTLYGY
jgi:hypothetical protein